MNLIDAMTRGMHWASLAILLALAVSINVDIFARNLFSHPLSGMNELMGQAIVIFSFCQLPNSFRRGQVLCNDSLLRRLEGVAPGFKRALTVLFHIAAFAALIPLVAQSIPMLINDWNSQGFVGAIVSFTWPIWPTRLAIIFGCLVLMAQIVCCGLRDIQ